MPRGSRCARSGRSVSRPGREITSHRVVSCPQKIPDRARDDVGAGAAQATLTDSTASGDIGVPLYWLMSLLPGVELSDEVALSDGVSPAVGEPLSEGVLPVEGLLSFGVADGVGLAGPEPDPPMMTGPAELADGDGPVPGAPAPEPPEPPDAAVPPPTPPPYP